MGFFYVSNFRQDSECMIIYANWYFNNERLDWTCMTMLQDIFIPMQICTTNNT